MKKIQLEIPETQFTRSGLSHEFFLLRNLSIGAELVYWGYGIRTGHPGDLGHRGYTVPVEMQRDAIISKYVALGYDATNTR